MLALTLREVGAGSDRGSDLPEDLAAAPTGFCSWQDEGRTVA
jgi:hypothetical protein